MKLTISTKPLNSLMNWKMKEESPFWTSWLKEQEMMKSRQVYIERQQIQISTSIGNRMHHQRGRLQNIKKSN